MTHLWRSYLNRRPSTPEESWFIDQKDLWRSCKSNSYAIRLMPRLNGIHVLYHRHCIYSLLLARFRHQFKQYYNHWTTFRVNVYKVHIRRSTKGKTCHDEKHVVLHIHSTWCRAAMFVYGYPRGMHFLRSWQQESFINEVVLFTNKVNVVYYWNIQQKLPENKD